jgi:hypothetical protein
MTGTIAVSLGLVHSGGFLQGRFAPPVKRMPAWRWEDIWLVYPLPGMLVLPWVFAVATIGKSILRVSQEAGFREQS